MDLASSAASQAAVYANGLKQGIVQFYVRSTLNKMELPEEWKESLIVPICK